MVIDKRLFGKKNANHFNYSSTKKGLESLTKIDFNSSSGGLQFMIIDLEEMAHVCVRAAHLIEIDEKELERIQSDRCKYGDLSADEIESLQYLYTQAIEALNDELASLCGWVI